MSLPDLTLEQRTAFAELLGSKNIDVLREMLGLVYDAAIQAQFDDHIGAAPHERTAGRRDQRNGTRTRGLNTRAGSLDLDIPRARNSNFKPTVIEHFRRSERALVSVIQEAFSAESARARCKTFWPKWASSVWQNRRSASCAPNSTREQKSSVIAG